MANTPEPNPADMPNMDHLFRHEYGKLVAVLTNLFGSQHLELAEDMAQEALVKALEAWRMSGPPENPSAWLMRVAKNKAIDVLRREKRKVRMPEEPSAFLETHSEASVNHFSEEDVLPEDHPIKDDQLRMFFACCHPSLKQEAQVALVLKTLGGFSTGEIAKAFLAQEDTIQKRLYRAKQQFKEQRVALEIPEGHELPERLNAVLTAIYLLFNEGYNSTAHEELIRRDLVEEALRLGFLLTQHPTTAQGPVYALLALMCCHTARMDSRVDVDGGVVLLKDQDRSLWNRSLIQQANTFLNQSMQGDQLSRYHLEAAIAYEHCSAPTYAQTNWANLLSHYDTLLVLAPSPIVALNRAVVLSELQGPTAALAAIEAIAEQKVLEKYYMYHAIVGDLYGRLDRVTQAVQHLEQARQLTQSPKEKQLLAKKMEDLLA